jgi:protein-tyrosine kinase
MSQIKKALERAKAERLTQVFVEAAEEQQPQTIAKDEPQFSYTRTRVVDVSMEELVRRRIVTVQEKNPLADQFRRLRTRLLRQTRPRKWNTIQVSGFDTGEGKSLVAANLAVSLSQDTRQTTVLVDLDFRRPAVARLLGLSPDTPGLKSYFFDGVPLEDLFVNPGIAKLTVLTAGGSISRSTELVGSPKMESLIKELKECYDDRYVILDTPGIAVCSDPTVISEYVDAILLVARVDRTSQDSIKSAMAHIHREKLLGVVLNGVSPKDMVSYY